MNFDLETFTYDEAWLREAVRLESAAGIDIQIGGTTAPQQPIDPSQLQVELTKVRLFSVLFTELKHLLEQANLGAGLEAALTRGRLLLQRRLRSLLPEQVQSLTGLIVEKADREADSAQSQISAALLNLLEESDWQEIASAAKEAVQMHLLEQVSLRRSA